MSVKAALGRVYRSRKLVEVVVVAALVKTETVAALVNANSDIIVTDSPK